MSAEKTDRRGDTCANSRRTASFALMRWLATREFPQGLIAGAPDRAFVQDLVYTAIRRLRPLRLVLGKFLSKGPKGELEALLYVGAAQLLYMDSVPDFAAVNETVAAARLCPNRGVSKVVNAVLRNIARRRGEIEEILAAAPFDVRESFPSVLARRWSARFGEERAAELCREFNVPAKTFIARKDGSFTELERGRRVEDVPGYAEGDFIVQDKATSAAVELAHVAPGERVLDACAAPGGKAIQLAWRGAEVTACEVNGLRRLRLSENLARTRVSARVVSSVGEIPEGESFDVVLVDAPCSNTGVLRRRPDARWNFSEERLSALVGLQKSILDNAFRFVRPGGRLVYSTCSIEKEENSAQAASFAARHPEFSLSCERELMPSADGSDGAYAALFQRSAEGRQG